VVWTLAPPVLIILAIREWWKASGTGLRIKVIPIATALVGLADWSCFVTLFALGCIGGFGSHYVTTRSADWFVYGSLALLGATFGSRVARWKLALASLLMFALWVGSEMVA
jgi:hypothetical protein